MRPRWCPAETREVRAKWIVMLKAGKLVGGHWLSHRMDPSQSCIFSHTGKAYLCFEGLLRSSTSCRSTSEQNRSSRPRRAVLSVAQKCISQAFVYAPTQPGVPQPLIHLADTGGTVLLRRFHRQGTLECHTKPGLENGTTIQSQLVLRDVVKRTL